MEYKTKGFWTQSFKVLAYNDNLQKWMQEKLAVSTLHKFNMSSMFVG